MEKDYQTFLREIRDRVSALVVEDNAVKKRFANQIGKVSDLHEIYKEAYKRQFEKLAKWGKTKAARDHSRKFQEWEKKREADQNAGQPPVGPAFPEDELPPNPLAWFGLRPECTLTDSQKSTRFYSLLGIVHDGYTWEHGGRFEYIRKDLRKKDTILDSMWWCGQLRKDPQYEGLIEEALTYVKKDLAEKSKGKVKKIIGWIFKKTSHFIGAIIVAIIGGLFVAILIDIFGDFGWLEQFKAFIYNILRLK